MNEQTTQISTSSDLLESASTHEANDGTTRLTRHRLSDHRAALILCSVFLVALTTAGIVTKFPRLDTNPSTISMLMGTDVERLPVVSSGKELSNIPPSEIRGAGVAPALIETVDTPNWGVETDAVDGATALIFDVSGAGSEWGLRKNLTTSKWEIYFRKGGFEQIVATTDVRDGNQVALAREGDYVRFSTGGTRMDVLVGPPGRSSIVGLASPVQPPNFGYFNLFADPDSK